MLGFGAASFLADRELLREKHINTCPWCPSCRPRRSPQKTTQRKIFKQKSCLRKTTHRERSMDAIDEHHAMARTKTTKSVRFKDRNSYRSASAHSVFRDASNDRRHSTTRRSKSTRPKTSTSTFSALFSMPVNQGPVDEMILGAPGTHLLLSRFAKDRDAIRRRFEERADSDKSSKKPKSRNIFRRMAAL